MNKTIAAPAGAGQEQWLKTYYFTRAGFSIAWVLAALTAAPHALAASVLLLLYPAWDALANGLDGARSGGLKASRTQALNVAVSALVTLAIALSLRDMHRVLAVFGIWAILSGMLQFATAMRRRTTSGAQWAMLLSGAQSALAGGVFIFQAGGAAEPTVATIAGYAGFGAFYFLLSGLASSVKARRRRRFPDEGRAVPRGRIHVGDGAAGGVDVPGQRQ
jgi:hypothetical protein